MKVKDLDKELFPLLLFPSNVLLRKLCSCALHFEVIVPLIYEGMFDIRGRVRKMYRERSTQDERSECRNYERHMT